MAYSNVPIGTANPGCIVILVDQSLSMNEAWEDGTKAEVAALAVNRVLDELVSACRQGTEIRDRLHVSVIGYGERVECVVNGMISEIASPFATKKLKKLISDGAGGTVEVEVEIPIWVQPQANNGTPMHEAFERAADIVQHWCDDNPDSFPPIVINITDGEANQPVLTGDAARKVMNLHTTDGNALVFNIHIANNKREVIFPHSTAQLMGDSFAEFLFGISSILPAPLRERAKRHELPAEPNTRGFVYNANPVTVTRILQFGSPGTMEALPSPTG